MAVTVAGWRPIVAFIKPSKEQYNPDLDLKVAGQFWSTCRRVEQGIEDHEHRGKTKIAVEFEIDDRRFPQLKGQRTSFVVGESIYRGKTDGKTSAFLQWAEMMGVPNAEKGFDPETEFVGKRYFITTELWSGKARVRKAVPPAPADTPASPPPPPPPPPDAAPRTQADIPF